MSTTLTIAVNTSTNDVEYTTSGSTWEIIDTANDYLVFSGGSDAVIDGADIPSQSELSSAGIVLNGTQQIVSNYFVVDVSENELQRTAGVSLTIYQPENLASLIKSRRVKQDNKSVIAQFKKARQSAVAVN